MKCRLSIIIPIYKAEPFLRQCLDAIVNQSAQPYEVILVNDGSPDNCDVICNEYVERYPFFKYLKQDNQGVSVARNNGIALATGDYLTFCDPDDYYTQDFY
ncbi:MAG: glycosyltransferase, partial [Porphyromonas somerae]|nr:glycosyltransferase [Porphyromonas somerae]